jgi:hypothetical protein
MSRPLTPDQLREIARVARSEGVTITIESGGRVYRIAPGEHNAPITASERDASACDRAFGLSG